VVKGIAPEATKELIEAAKQGIKQVVISLHALGRTAVALSPAITLMEAIEVGEDDFVVRGLTPAQYKLLIRAAGYGIDELSQVIHQNEGDKLKPLAGVKQLIRNMENSGVLLNDMPSVTS
jgi:hypothetical protein